MKKVTLTLSLFWAFYQVALCQCHPNVTNSGITDDYIKEFSFGVNIKQNIQEYLGDYYVDSMTSTYTAGLVYPFTVQSGSLTLAQDIAIWADWNTDGDFVDIGEAVFNSSSPIVSTTILNGNITIPAIPNGYYTLRIASIRSGATSVNSCNINGYGQVEDIRIAIGTTTICSGIPNAGNAIFNYGLNGSVLTTTLFLNGASYESNLSYLWQRSAFGTGPWVPISGNSHFLTFNTVPSYQCYRCIITCVTTGMSDTSTITCASDITACSPLSLGNTLATATTICPGNAVNLSMQFPPLATSLVSYQWYNSNGPIIGATNATYTYIATTTDTFYCQVTCSMNGYSTTSYPVAVIVSNINSSASSSNTTCNTYTWNATTYTNSGIYTQTFLNAVGCDSVHTLSLTIHQNSTNTVIFNACDSIVINGSTYTASGVYTQTLVNAIGCDSVLYLDLQIGASNDSVITSTDCDYYLAGGVLYTSSGIYTQTFTNSGGCDSLMHYNLTINQSSDSLINAVSCNLFTLNGQTYTSSGTYTQSFTNAAGCDSALTLQISVDTLNATITINSVAISTPNIGTYQWVDCATMTAIIGATNLNYTPTVSGDYAIEVTAGACVDTSICVPIWMTGLDNIQTEGMFICPNPSTGIFDLILSDNAEVEISNELGGTIFVSKLIRGTHVIDLSKYSIGVYYIKIVQANRITRSKVLMISK